MSPVSSSKASIKASSQPVAPMPSETVRGLVSLWLLFHLFGIVLALATDTGMGRSELLTRVKRAPILSQYLYALWLDVGHTYSLTNGQLDGDYSIEADLIYSDGHKDSQQLQPTDARGERLERYHALAMRSAAGTEFETPDTTVPYHVGGELLRQLKEAGVTEIVFQIRRHAPLSMADANGSDPEQRNPENPRTYSDLAAISVTLNSSDQPQVQVKSRSATDVAPVTNPSQPQLDQRPGKQNRGKSNSSGSSETTTTRPPPAPFKLPSEPSTFDSRQPVPPPPANREPTN